MNWNFQTLDDHSVTIMSSRVGLFTDPVPLDEMVSVFGESLGASGDGKVRDMWILRFPDGTIATIYDYVDDSVWHIGGFSDIAVLHVLAILERESVKSSVTVG